MQVKYKTRNSKDESSHGRSTENTELNDLIEETTEKEKSSGGKQRE